MIGIPKMATYERSTLRNSSLVSLSSLKTDNQLLYRSIIVRKFWELIVKKSAHTDWNGYTGVSGVIGGMAGLDGWYLEQVLHAAL